MDFGVFICKAKKKPVPDILSAHRASFCNEKAISKSEKCGCFYCLQLFEPADINEWISEIGGEKTAACPFCGIDSVIPDSSGFPLTEEFLKDMYEYWFG